jgi:hypothetical protein
MRLWYETKVKEEGGKGNTGSARIWAKFYTELIRQKEKALQSQDGVNIDIMADDEVAKMRADKGLDQAIPNVTDPVNPMPTPEAPKANMNLLSRLGNFFKGGSR